MRTPQFYDVKKAAEEAQAAAEYKLSQEMDYRDVVKRPAPVRIDEIGGKVELHGELSVYCDPIPRVVCNFNSNSLSGGPGACYVMYRDKRYAAHFSLYYSEEHDRWETVDETIKRGYANVSKPAEIAQAAPTIRLAVQTAMVKRAQDYVFTDEGKAAVKQARLSNIDETKRNLQALRAGIRAQLTVIDAALAEVA